MINGRVRPNKSLTFINIEISIVEDQVIQPTLEILVSHRNPSTLQ